MNKTVFAIFGTVLWGVFNTASAELTPFYEESADSWSCGYKNELGEVIVPTNRYEDCGDFSDGLAYVGKMAQPLVENDFDGYKYLQGFIDQTGELVIPVEHEAVEHVLGVDYKSFSEGLVAVYRNGKYGYMDKMRELVIPYRYQSADDFNDGLAIVSQNDKYGAIDKSGRTVVPFKFKYLSSYSDDLALYTEDNHWNDSFRYGFVDTIGDVAIKAQWDDACPFSNGLAAVRVGDYDTGKWGIINKSGNYVVKPTYHAPQIQTWSEYELDPCYYQDGTINMYKYTDRSRPHESSVTRYILDTKGNVINTRFFQNWDKVIEDFESNYNQCGEYASPIIISSNGS